MSMTVSNVTLQVPNGYQPHNDGLTVVSHDGGRRSIHMDYGFYLYGNPADLRTLVDAMSAALDEADASEAATAAALTRDPEPAPFEVVGAMIVDTTGAEA